MTAVRPLPPGAVRFGDLPRHAQLRHFLQSAIERRDRAREGYVRTPRQYHLGERGWTFDPRAASRSLPRYEARVGDLLAELGQSIIERLDAPIFPAQPSAEELEAAHWEALVAERDALAAKLAAVEQLAERWGTRQALYRAQGSYTAAGVLTRTTTQLQEAIA